VHKGELDVAGGGREGRESPWETFQRETFEEFGLTLTKEDLIWARAYPSNPDPAQIGYYAVVQLPEAAAQDIRFGDEGQGYLITPLADFLNAPDAWPAYQNRARDFAEAAGLLF